MINREAASNYAAELCTKITDRKPFFDQADEKYGISVDILSDICANRRDVSEFNDFVIFAIIDLLDNKSLKKFFTKTEIDQLKGIRYTPETFSLPICFDNMCQVDKDQWIGLIHAKDLMKLKDQQVIKYNENTQRTLQKIVHGENRYFRIALNKKAIREIRASMENHLYIPDDITLNMPVETTEFEFRNGSIIIEKMDKLDILDGYHRYIAISQIAEADPEFDYPMELRIVNFTTEKAKQFIYQKDQKTLMKRVDSHSFNQYDPANAVVERLNQDPLCNVTHMIGQKLQIDPSYLSGLVHYYYFNSQKKYTNRDILQVKEILKQKINEFTDAYPEYLDKTWSNRELSAMIYCFSKKEMYPPAMIKYVIDNANEISSDLFVLRDGSLVRRKLINELATIAGRWKG